MDYAKYKTIAAEVNADNALETVQKLLEQAQADSVETAANIASLTEQINEGKAKYNDLQVDYIRRFTTQGTPDDSLEDTDELTQEQIEELIAEQMKGDQ